MPLLGVNMTSRTQIFQELKPKCVALSEAALTLNGPRANSQTVSLRLQELHNVLCSVIKTFGFLDEKLADYVFFPLSQILRRSQTVSLRCLELTLQCLAILIDRGWRGQIQSQLAAQVIILCSLMAEQNPKGLSSTESTDELRSSALTCLANLFANIEASSTAGRDLTSQSNFPQLGQSISTILDAVMNGTSARTQIEGINALSKLIKNIATRDLQAAFLPGMVSKLTQVLTPQTKQRRNHAVLIVALDVLQSLFSVTLQDSPVSSERSTVIDSKWLETAATQLKPAISNVLRLTDHERIDVKEALARFCITILGQCSKNLHTCVAPVLEALLFLSADKSGDSIGFRLESLLATNPDILAQLLDIVHDWVQSLPTKMQSADEQMKVQRLHQLRSAYSIIVTSDADTSTLNRLLANSLRDSVTITIQLVPPKSRTLDLKISPTDILDLAVQDDTPRSTKFDTALVRHAGQQAVLEAADQLAKVISKSPSSNIFSADLARSLRRSRGEEQIASFWLLLQAMQQDLEQGTGIEEFLILSPQSSSSNAECIEDMYSFALETLSGSVETETDTRLEALSLRALSLRAQVAGREFRFELVDALYPVLHTLATPIQHLQQDSITALNIFTSSCGYGSVKQLVVDNADYLTNAVALRLNSFDVRPQAPQVLLMMVRLAGPGLVPYLEDTVESIFAALEDYHGYPVLVELMFKVLSVIAEEGARASALAITEDDRKKIVHLHNERPTPVNLTGLAHLLREKAVDQHEMNLLDLPTESHPRLPGSGPFHSDESSDQKDDFEGSDTVEDDPLPPAPTTYALLLKITELTQHYLPSASGALRASLLTLIKTTTPAIAQHENSFLPLINTLWPEIVSRLDDSELHVVSMALDIITLLCEHARDFLRGRILQLWPKLCDINERAVKAILQTSSSGLVTSQTPREQSSTTRITDNSRAQSIILRMQKAASEYSDPSTRLLWNSFVHTISACVEFVGLPPENFDEALHMLEPALEDEGVRSTFECENADAVWLMRLRNGHVCLPRRPNVDPTFASPTASDG